MSTVQCHCDKPSPYHSTSFGDSNTVVFPFLISHIFNCYGPLNGKTSELLLATTSSPSYLLPPLLQTRSVSLLLLMCIMCVCGGPDPPSSQSVHEFITDSARIHQMALLPNQFLQHMVQVLFYTWFAYHVEKGRKVSAGLQS